MWILLIVLINNFSIFSHWEYFPFWKKNPCFLKLQIKRLKKNWKLIIWAKHQLLVCLKRAMHTLLCPITQVRIMVVKIHFYNYLTRISYFAWKLDNIFGKKKKKIIFLKTMFGQKQLMSSAAHQFGRVEYCIPNICYYFLQADVVEKSKQIFKIRHVQTVELPRT